ncbi:acid-sensing ion channel 2-like [Acanthaster planci]|uniref:Acid-sensing ion channel 2-like n=1 Tax=Acanthaster planci TaxID=133434 RepID=A0A8B7ZEG4_ACAPL|nr:acid-sensing ion channel 2-like [Acanthaster planci]
MGCYKRCYLRQWALTDTDLHGVKHIAGEGGILRRLIWAACFLAALVVFLHQATLTLIHFVEKHHVTKVDISYRKKLDFPAVTVCNFNKYRESALTDRDIRNVGYHLGIVDEDHNLINPYLYTEEFRRKMAAVDWSVHDIDDEYNMTEFTNRTGHQLDEMIVECSWRDEPCSPDDFHHIFSHLGNCYTFNHVALATERHSSISAGAANGLKLTLNIQEEEYTPSNDLHGAAEDAGIKWMLHHPSEPPYVKELGFGAGPGHHTFVAVRHEEVESLPSPYTPCMETSAGFLDHFDHYSLQACRIECETEVVVQRCGCRLVEQPGNAPVCNPAETHECAQAALVHAVAGHGDQACDCSSPCSVESYPFTTTNVRLRAKYIERIYSNTTHNFSADYIQNNLVLLSIYYEALNAEVIEQLPEMTVPSLLAALGGNFGLFLGASVLTIVELLEYVFDELTASCTRRKTSGRISNAREILTVRAAPISVIDTEKELEHGRQWNR